MKFVPYYFCFAVITIECGLLKLKLIEGAAQPYFEQQNILDHVQMRPHPQ